MSSSSIRSFLPFLLYLPPSLLLSPKLSSLPSLRSEHVSATLSTALLLPFDIFLFITFPFSFFPFHIHFFQKCLSQTPTLSLRSANRSPRLTTESQLSSTASNMMWWCSFCSTSTALRLELVPGVSVGQLPTLMTVYNTKCTITTWHAKRAVTTLPFAWPRLWMR